MARTPSRHRGWNRARGNRIVALGACLAIYGCVWNIQQALRLDSLVILTTPTPPTSTSTSTSSFHPPLATVDKTTTFRSLHDDHVPFNASLLAFLPNITTLHHETYSGPLTQRDQRVDQNKTKIVGFITSKYFRIALRWYDRLETLGYTNHYIICTDQDTYHKFRTSYDHYRVEASYLPPWPPTPTTNASSGYFNPYDDLRRLRMLFAHRWVYLLEQLKLGNHILLTDVDNIFSSYYSMTELELSEYDVYHALETRHPEDVWNYQGFVFCGGMGWFRSSPRTIRFMEEMVYQCGMECDDQEVLNGIIAYVLRVSWNRTGDDHDSLTPENEETNARDPKLGDHFKRLAGLVTKGFTGYSVTTGIKIKVWDRDFAYRGSNEPLICPQGNWVSMPFVIYSFRRQAPKFKLKSYDLWDNRCPNAYTNLRAGHVTKDYNSV